MHGTDSNAAEMAGAGTLVGDEIEVGGYVIQPVAKVSGGRWQSPEGEAAGEFVHLSPTEVIIHGQDGVQDRLPLPFPTKQVLMGMLAGAAAISAISGVIMGIALLWSWRASKV